ncbi:MAG: peptidoglycan editing factor PgeF [Prevotella sp.]|nr:peptidoglycan editing factor PgeF [Prevotella sp.]
MQLANETIADGLIRYPWFSRATAFTTTRGLGRDFRRLSGIIGIAEERIIAPHQVHSDSIFRVTPDLFSLPEDERRARLEGVDAVFTTMRGVCVGVSTADCVPVLLADEETGIAAAVHAGWRGTVKRIVQKTIAAAKVQAATMRAVIGPAISCERFEVGDEVYEAFRNEGFDMAKIALRKEKWHIDLQECNRRQLLELGVREENIFVEKLCTYDNADLLFSARREQRGAVKCERNFNAILLDETL